MMPIWAVLLFVSLVGLVSYIYGWKHGGRYGYLRGYERGIDEQLQGEFDSMVAEVVARTKKAESITG
jgi:hypothetical protein